MPRFPKAIAKAVANHHHSMLLFRDMHLKQRHLYDRDPCTYHALISLFLPYIILQPACAPNNPSLETRKYCYTSAALWHHQHH